MRTLLQCLGLAVVLLSPAIGSRAYAQPVDLALVLAIDVSESVDADEYELQREGIARAFESPALVQAVAAGQHGAILVAVLEWSDRDRQVITVDWTRVSDAETAVAVARRLRGAKRTSNGVTAIAHALLAAAALLEDLPAPAERRVIDVSGDGIATLEPSPRVVRDALVEQGVVINGLAILTEEPWLEDYYNQYVAGGPGAFVMAVEDFASFAEAILAKLLAEIAAFQDPGVRIQVSGAP